MAIQAYSIGLDEEQFSIWSHRAETGDAGPAAELDGALSARQFLFGFLFRLSRKGFNGALRLLVVRLQFGSPGEPLSWHTREERLMSRPFIMLIKTIDNNY